MADHFFEETERANVALFVVWDSRILYANAPLEALMGYDSGALTGVNWLDLVHADYCASIEEILLHKSSSVSRQEIQVIRRDGKLLWIDLVTTPTVFENRPAVIGTSFDITERKQAELGYQLHIEQLEIIQEVDAQLTQHLEFDYVLKIALEAAVNLTQASAGAIHLMEDGDLWIAQVIGNYPASLIGSHIPLDRGIVGRVFRTQRAELVMDVEADPDYISNVIETKAQMTVPLLAHERLIGVINVQTTQPEHFTEQKFDFLRVLGARIASALENARLYHGAQLHLAELQKLYEQVSGLERMKTQMIRIAAHDLRNPLGVISGFLQMLGWDMETHLTDRSREHLQIIHESIERIDKITRDILTLEKMTANQELPTERVDLREIVALACEEFRTQAKEKALDYDFSVPLPPVLVRGDRILLRETVGNLIGNAIKYTPEKGQVTVHLKTEAKQVIFEVEDTGYGIPQDKQSELFKPFFRVQLKETRSIKGTGLGLHLVKSIIEHHQGQVHFASTYGKGSLFGFELPLAEKASANSHSRKNNARASH